MHAQPYLFLPAVFLLLIFLGTISVYEDGWNYFSAATTTHLAKVSAKVRNFHCPHQEVPFPLGSRRMNCSDIDKYITVTDILLGKGKLKKVRLACFNGTSIAITHLMPDPERENPYEQRRELFRYGIEIIERLQKIPGIVRMYGYCLADHRESMLLQLGAYGPLAVRAGPKKAWKFWGVLLHLNWCTRLRMAQDIALIIQSLHDHGYIFCDWSTEQFVYTEDFRIILIDTNNIVKLSNTTVYYNTTCNSFSSGIKRILHFPQYAPEQFGLVPMTFNFDSFKFARIILEGLLDQGVPPHFFERDFQDLVHRATLSDPNKRLNMLQMLKIFSTWETRYCAY